MICFEQYKKILKTNKIKIIKYVYNRLFNRSLNFHILLFRMLKAKNKIRKYILRNKIEKKFCCFISEKAYIDTTVIFEHYLGVCIGSNAYIGKNVVIYQNVTIGKKNNECPIIKDNVKIYSGAIVIGNIIVGSNAIIGAGSIVVHNVDDNSIVVGNPAQKMIK